MAKKPVGYKSPFYKKSSPHKWWQIAALAAPGIIKAAGSLIGRKKRIREQRAARAEMAEAKKAYMDMKFTNPLEGIQNPYAENLYEDLTVDTQSADYLRQQQQQQQANIMQGLRGAAGASGIAGLAQSMANVGARQAQQGAASISQQVRQNQMLALKGEQQRRKGAFDVDVAKRQAQQKYVVEKEQARMEKMYGLGLDRLSAADKARSTARSDAWSGLGQAVGAVGGHYMPGGMGYGHFDDDMFKLRSNIGNWAQQRGIWDPNK
tara:strand:- start:580 stop:1371 length:792 start_codon:yes stop_codon:yes gene_type:complete